MKVETISKYWNDPMCVHTVSIICCCGFCVSVCERTLTALTNTAVAWVPLIYTSLICVKNQKWIKVTSWGQFKNREGAKWCVEVGFFLGIWTFFCCLAYLYFDIERREIYHRHKTICILEIVFTSKHKIFCFWLPIHCLIFVFSFKGVFLFHPDWLSVRWVSCSFRA